MTRFTTLACVPAVLALTATLLATPAQAAPRHGDEAWSNGPDQNYSYRDDRPASAPQRDCYVGRGQARTSGAGALVGALVGGFIGNAIGHGTAGQVLTTGVGILGGAMIGNSIEGSRRDGRVNCDNVDYREPRNQHDRDEWRGDEDRSASRHRHPDWE
ncbi:glycine zipper 2TM domain-containing protein [Aquabacterium sp.]|uniref:glycine zipper 2TM domain-containing protein n=1 Tax=Aquabacterium sp. TaxID=1872578 RepID=UPI0035B36998